MGRIVQGDNYKMIISDEGRTVRILQGVWIDQGPGVPGFHSFYETRLGDWYRNEDGDVLSPDDLADVPLEERNSIDFMGYGWVSRGINAGGSEYTPWVGATPFGTEDGALEAAMAEYEE